MMKTGFDLGKAVKKLSLQGKSLEYIANLYNSTIDECFFAYQKFMGITPTSKESKELEKLIKNNKSVHVYGETGSGKTTLIKEISSKLGFSIRAVYPKSENDLLTSWGDDPFEELPVIFVLHGDAYYWKKYGLVKKYISENRSPIVIETTDKSTPTKNITKLVVSVKVHSPTRSDVSKFLKSLGSDTPVSEVYDKDWRKVWRNYLYGKKIEPNKKDKFDAKTMVQKILKGTAQYSDFDDCIHPLSFILNWLGYNAKHFYDKSLKRNLDIISFVDAHKYNLKLPYLRSLLLQLPRMEKKGELVFPPYKMVKESEPVEEVDYEINLIKRKKNIKKQIAQKPILEFFEEEEDDLGEFMLL